MKKPEKKEKIYPVELFDIDAINQKKIGYNLACDDWEEYTKCLLAEIKDLKAEIKMLIAQHIEDNI